MSNPKTENVSPAPETGSRQTISQFFHKRFSPPKVRLSAHGHLTKQMLLVAAAFAAMVLVSYLFVSRIVSEQMDIQSRATFENTYHHVGAIFNNLEMITLNLAADVEIAVNEGKSVDDIREHLRVATTFDRIFFQREGERTDEEIDIARRTFRPERFYAHLEYNGPNCVIHDEYIHGGGWIPPEGYDFREREWYREITNSNGELVYTNLYVSARTHNYSFGLGRKLYAGEAGEYQPIGVLQLNVEVSQMEDIVTSLQQLERRYATLVSPSGLVVVHLDSAQIGKHLSETSLGGKHIGENFENISRDYTNPSRFYSRNADGVWCVYNCGVLPNGWLVASVIPVWDYRAYERLVGIILLTLGSFLATVLCFFLRRLTQEKDLANLRNQSKSMFLARMSHEIRTPMNAIAGLSQMIVREKGQLPQKIANYSIEIQHAANNLLAIINDVLDLSKIEAGKLEITKFPFALSALLDDVIRITHIRSHEKGLQFTSFVDARLPENLIGDVVHIRQILLNLLTNAVKYTREGYIAFDVIGTKTSEKTVVFSFIVRDTGVGIKHEDQGRLFADFAQVGMESNWNIEGTGLGLAICKELVSRLDGTVTIASQPGAGTTFTVNLPIEMENAQPCATVQHVEDHHVLIYEPRGGYEQSLIRTLEHLGVFYERVQSVSSLHDMLRNNRDISLVFVASFVFDEVSRFIGTLDISGMQVILLCESPDQNTLSYAKSAMLPINALHIANFLNDAQADIGEVSDVHAFFKMPAARILVVDDNQPNLMVAEGLLAPYESQVNFAASGKEALQNVQQYQYDLIFMDHMMPEMDGIETTRHIRDLAKTSDGCQYCESVPIVAFTANAIFGMKEVFLQNGMDDLLTKPIDPTRLNEILQTWIPKEKQQLTPSRTFETKSLTQETIQIPGVNTRVGMMQTGGTVEGYLRVLGTLCSELETKTKTMENALKNNDLSTYKIGAHSYKSFLATIGVIPLSATAAMLEIAAQNEDRATIDAHHKHFINELWAIAASVEDALSTMGKKLGNTADSVDDHDWLYAHLTLLKSAIMEKKMLQIDSIMDDLLEKNWTTDVKKRLEKITQSITLFEWSEAMGQIDLLLEH